MAIQRSDELNNLSSYFEEMDLPDKEKKKRINLAEEIFDLMLYLFLMIKDNEDADRDEIIALYTNKFEKAMDKYIPNILEKYPSLESYAQKTITQLVDTTYDKMLAEYFTSSDRALYVAETETNKIGNEVAFQDALDAGYTSKTWVTMGDSKVRYTHWSVDGLTVGINDVFHVGDSYMSCPCDINGSPEEVINCRCVLKFGY